MSFDVMATHTEVKNYLAYWFQLGKRVVSDDGRLSYGPGRIIQGDRFTPEFEDSWEAILEKEGKSLFLEGTDQTIAELLSPAWDVVSCARCSMPVPIPQVEISAHPCPCNDMDGWPNEEIPKPRLPVSTHNHLYYLKKRMQADDLKA